MYILCTFLKCSFTTTFTVTSKSYNTQTISSMHGDSQAQHICKNTSYKLSNSGVGQLIISAYFAATWHWYPTVINLTTNYCAYWNILLSKVRRSFPQLKTKPWSPSTPANQQQYRICQVKSKTSFQLTCCGGRAVHKQILANLNTW